MKHTLAVYCLSMASAFSADLGFSKMEDGDRVEITEQSDGCFHNTTSYYEVRKEKSVCTFTEYSITWKDTKPFKTPDKKITGKTILTPKDIESLDKLLQFYRTPKTTSSTTQTSLVIEYYEQDRRIRVEKLTDESGGSGLYSIQFHDLTSRFQK